MKQQTLAMAADQGGGFERYRRRTKREDFLDAMEAIVPWAALCAVIEPHQRTRPAPREPIDDAMRNKMALSALKSHQFTHHDHLDHWSVKTTACSALP